MKILIEAHARTEMPKPAQDGSIPIWEAEKSVGFVRIEFSSGKQIEHNGAGFITVVNELHMFFENIINSDLYVPLLIYFSPRANAKKTGSTIKVSFGQKDNFEDFVVDEISIDEAKRHFVELGKQISRYGRIPGSRSLDYLKDDET